MGGVDRAEGFYELVGPPDRAAGPADAGQLVGLGVGKVLGVAQQHEPAALEGVGRVVVHRAHGLPLLAAGVIEGLRGEGHRMERVQADRCVRGLDPDGLGVGGAEVHGNWLEAGGGFFAEVIEERFERDGAAVLGSPDDLAGVVVDDQGQMFVTAFPGDLIDTDVHQVSETGQVRLGRDDAFKDPGHGRHDTRHSTMAAVFSIAFADHEIEEVA